MLPCVPPGHRSRPGWTALVETAGIGRQVAAGMAAQILRPGYLSRVPSKIRCERAMVVSEWVADHIAQIAIALEALLQLSRGTVALRMNKDEHAQFFGFGPKGIELGIAQLRAGDVAADANPAQPILLDALVQLFGGKVGELQGNRKRRRQSARMLGAHLGEPLVL